jgi:hypothetical protein
VKNQSKKRGQCLAATIIAKYWPYSFRTVLTWRLADATGSQTQGMNFFQIV